MIIHLKQKVNEVKANELATSLKAILITDNSGSKLVTSSSVKELPEAAAPYAESHFVAGSDIQLADVNYVNKRVVDIAGVEVGNPTNTLMITGPCSIESKEQIEQAAELCVEMGVKVLRAGCYKPRTSPYSFQGMGLDGLKLLAETGQKYGLKIITEVRDATHVDHIIEYSDIVQIGAKAMYDHGILKRCAQIRKPVLLKRGFGTTLQEFVQSSEFILSGGNSDVMLCERGIRTFETKTRFTLDLCGVAWLKEHTNLPIILDTSHAIGYRYGVPDLTRACVAMGVDGLLIETHPNPKVAKSDAAQQLDFDQFRAMYKSLQPIAAAIGKTIV